MSLLWARLTGQHRKAAEHYLREGKLERAAAMYRKAGDLVEAARLWLRSGHQEKALAALEGADPESAGELLSQENLDHLAIRCYEEAGAYWQAAECARRLDRHLRAAGLFEQAGALEQAARSYAQAGEQRELLRVWKTFSRQLERAGRHDEQRRIDGLRARRLVEVGDLEQAAEILEHHERWIPAAKVWHRARRIDRAIVAYLEGGNGLLAAELLDRSEVVLESPLRARILESVSRHEEAASAYEEAGDLSGAMRQLEAAGAYAAAAEKAEHRGENERARELWISANRPAEAIRLLISEDRQREAAELARRSGENRSAAELYRELGDHLRAAQEFLKDGALQEAIGDLEEVPHGSDDHDAASRLLVPLLVEVGHFEAALGALQALGAAEGTESGTYWRGRCEEGLGRTVEAIECYRAVVAVSPRYRDAASRLENLEKAADEARAAVSVRDYLRSGERLQGRYEIEEEVGRGGDSRVYRARDVVRRQPVAVKLLSRISGLGGDPRARLLEEIRLGRRLRHPNIVRLEEAGEDDGRLFMVMEWLQGRSLAELLARDGPLPEPQVLDIGLQVASGLEAAHRESVIHRDLKPSNLQLVGDDVRIVDFGIALSMDRDVGLDEEGKVLGSPLYMSPEQIRGDDLDARSDLYSLGVVLFTCLAGCEPFQGVTVSAVSLKHLQDPPPDLRRMRSDVSRPLVELVGRLLEKNPADRPATAGEVTAALRSISDDPLE